ncbi:MAG TPA: hypothetical protein PLI43_11050 [Albidovulum sp.]|uniref:hypothetical protein n=1 Tax=Albidovulum sp. TaxID=1872424 RepID=UPI002C9EA718|nr:hypothetical protein [Albidovulum sp.]
MSFTFAIRCRLRQYGRATGAGPRRGLARTLIVTRLEYPHDIISLSDCDPGLLTGDTSPMARFSLLGAPSPRRPDATRFAFLAEAPPDVRISSRFLPASGNLRLRWGREPPRVSASFGAPLSDCFLPSAVTTLWTLAGVYVAWRGELLPGAIGP